MISSGVISVTHRHVAGDEDHRAVLAERAREREREAGEHRRQRASAGSPAERLPARGAELAAASSTRGRAPRAPAARVRTTNGRPMKVSATTIPSGVNATLMPSGASGAPIQPFGA